MIALYQNGERIMPGNGYPMCLLLPGWEGNMNIIWVRRIQLTETPGMTFYEARTYAPILPGGKAYRFYFVQEVKSFITHPSPGLALKGLGSMRFPASPVRATAALQRSWCPPTVARAGRRLLCKSRC